MLLNGKLCRLFLSIEMYSATHEDKRCVQAFLVMFRVKVLPCIQYDLVFDAFLLAIWIDADVSKNSQAELSNLLFMLFNEDLLNVSLRDYVIKSSNCRFSKQRLNTKVTEGQVGETFK